MQKNIFEIALSGTSMQEIIDGAEELLGNPLAFVDCTQNESLFSKNYPMEDIEDKLYRRSNITESDYQKDTEYLTSLALTGRPHIITWTHIRRKRMICGSIVSGRYLGGIRLPDVGNRLEDIDPELVSDVARVMGVALMLHGWPNLENTHGQYFLWNILNGKANPSFLSNSMIYPLFPKSCTFRMLWYVQGAGGVSQDEHMELFGQLRSYCQVPYEGGFAVLADSSEFRSKEASIHEAACRQNLLIGVSDEFQALDDIREQVGLAQNVRHYALFARQGAGLALFNDYKVYHLLSSVRGTPLQRLCVDDRVRAVLESDRTNGTEYIETLRAYLHCNQNASECAKELCIHRNTVFYRINRLSEQFGIDLHQTETLVSIRLSLILLNGEGA